MIKEKNQHRILIVAAHPDDEVLGCGGTIARLAEEGHSVRILILGEGLTSRTVRREDTDSSVLENLRREAENVARFLGVESVIMESFPDNRFDTIPLLDIVKRIEAEIDDFQPNIMYTHHNGDLNIDHSITHRAVLTAARPMEGFPVKEIYAFEVASSTDWAFGEFAPVFIPNVFIDVSKTLIKKIQAMEMYSSEKREFPHPRSKESLESCAKRWGAVSGLKVAEAFRLIRKIDL